MADRDSDTNEPRARTYVTWTPALLQAAEIQADAGHLRLAADLCETMFGDDRIKAVLDTRTDTLLGLNLKFEGRSRRAVAALDAKEDWWSIFPEAELKLFHAWALLLGVAVARIVWSKGDRDIPRLHVKNPRNLKWNDDKHEWLFQARDGEITVTAGDGLWVVYTPFGSNRPWVHGAYRALSRWSLLKQYAISDWGSYSERHGQGVYVATGVKGSAADRSKVVSQLRGLGRRGAMATPEGSDIKLLEASAKTWDTFSAQIAAADNGYAVTVLGQNLTTQAGLTGNQGAASIHQGVALGRTKADVQTLSTCLHDQVLTHWAEMNFGDRSKAPYPVWDTSVAADRKDDAAVLQMVSQALAGLVSSGAPVDTRALLERFGVPMTAPETVVEPTPAAAPAAPTTETQVTDGGGS
jgi:phage gp29-like protein